jgi:peptidoglycan/xylan/chitin deacetylase (PgdA/CDA1 family)
VGFNRPIVSLTFDDGWASYYNNGLPILNKYGFKATDYIISGYLGDTDYMTKAQVKNLYAAGHEIGSHTVDHPDLTSLSATKLNTELKNSQSALQTVVGVPITDFASPYGAYNQTVLNKIKLYYGSHRSVDTGFNAKSNFDVYDIKVQNMVSTTTLAQVQSWVQQAKATNTWLVLVYHQVDSKLDKTAEPYNTYQSDLDAQLAYIKSTGIAVDTVKQAIAELTPQL